MPDQFTALCTAWNLNVKDIPRHIAVIMDGNGRWAKQNKVSRLDGHREGAEALRRIIQASLDLKIRYLSVYAFSTENWRRSKTEVNYLMTLFDHLMKKEIKTFLEQRVEFRLCGDRSQLKPSLQKSISAFEEKTAEAPKMTLNVMMNYGSRAEILQACKEVIKNGVSADLLDEATFSQYLYTSGCPDPDLLIRSSGEVRLSNYMLWQIAYSECFFVETLWPDFNQDTLFQIIHDFQQRSRRFGGR